MDGIYIVMSIFFVALSILVSCLQNLLHVKEVDTPNCFGGIGYLGFEKLTHFPIQVGIMILAQNQNNLQT